MKRNLIAILRGVRPDEVVAVAGAILEAGIDTIEVPLNSPDPFSSIRLLVEKFGNTATIGAGTVLAIQDVDRLAEIGARLVVSPNCDAGIVRRTKQHGMISLPGVLTPSECYVALDAGADGLKFFPASVIGPSGIAAVRAVLPSDTRIFAVGGVGADAAGLSRWRESGATGFGIGSAIYKVGSSVNDVADAAVKIVRAYDAPTAPLP